MPPMPSTRCAQIKTQTCAVFSAPAEYPARGAGVSNTTFGSVADDFSSQSMIFNRLVDPERVACIVVNGFNSGNPDVVFLPEV